MPQYPTMHHQMCMGSSAPLALRRRLAWWGCGDASKGYDLDYIWKQVDRGPAKDAASYYIQASEGGGEPPGRSRGLADFLPGNLSLQAHVRTGVLLYRCFYDPAGARLLCSAAAP